MINSKAHMEQASSETGALTDADLEAINGGSILRDFVRLVVRVLHGDSDARRPTS